MCTVTCFVATLFFCILSTLADSQWWLSRRAWLTSSLVTTTRCLRFAGVLLGVLLIRLRLHSLIFLLSFRFFMRHDNSRHLRVINLWGIDLWICGNLVLCSSIKYRHFGSDFTHGIRLLRLTLNHRHIWRFFLSWRGILGLREDMVRPAIVKLTYLLQTRFYVVIFFVIVKLILTSIVSTIILFDLHHLIHKLIWKGRGVL